MLFNIFMIFKARSKPLKQGNLQNLKVEVYYGLSWKFITVYRGSLLRWITLSGSDIDIFHYIYYSHFKGGYCHEF